MCLGYRNGTNCHRVVRTTRHKESWEKFQLCSNCAKNDATKNYRDKMHIICEATISS